MRNRITERCGWLAIACLLAASALAQRRPVNPVSAPAWLNKQLSPDERADRVMAQMTLDEKIGLVHGTGLPGIAEPVDAEEAAAQLHSNGGAGLVPGIPRLGIPDLNMADSAVGVARGAFRGRYSTLMPSNLALGASWDPTLAHEYGALIGRELRDQGYNMSLAGGVNLAREPRNGRNFEYLGEDPILAGKMVGQYIRGIQDQKVIGDIKHYALNDQETGRHVANVNLDKRAMRETDLLAFEIGLRDSGAGAVMCSYNRINGDYGCENDYTLNQVLKKAWGFQGWVISDWGATHTTVKAALAGLDQEQPGRVYFGAALKKAIESGEVPMARLDDMVHRILRTEFAVGIVDNPSVTKVVDVFAGMEAARKVAEQGSVLLKNAKGALPLDPATVQSIAVIGSHADVGVLSGGGSAQVDPPGGNVVPQSKREAGNGGGELDALLGGPVWFPSSPLKSIRALAPEAKAEYNSGDNPAEAAALARRSQVAIVFVNQPSSEGRDLSLSLPGRQDRLVQAVAAANPRTIVVLETGAAVTMPWIDQVSAAVEVWFPGISGGEAIANILFGNVNPSGKLPLTFARSEADLPHPQVAGAQSSMSPISIGIGDIQIPQPPPFNIHYTEGLKVGYKWFDAEDKQPLFAFGHGLSYTTFEYSQLRATGKEVVFTVKNTGRRAGAEIAQVYAALPAAANEPPRRLVAWEKVTLGSGEARTVTLKLDPLHLSVFNVAADGWQLVPGDYRIFVGGSSRNTPLIAAIKVP